MKRSVLWKRTLAATLTVLAVVAGVWPLPAVAQATNEAPVDQSAITALENMGAYLRTLKAFQLEAVIQREEVLENGLKVQSQRLISLLARKPDRLRVDASSDWQERQYLYDGKQFTLWARRVNYYATVPAPPTIRELVDVLDQKFGVEMPLVDLFRWGSDAASATNITLAVDIGLSKVGGADCRQYAFRQEGLDCQVWIQIGDFPLPRKLVLTTTTDEARPQFQATCAWNLAPTFTEEDFTFKPPADACRIVFDEITPDTGSGTEEK